MEEKKISFSFKKKADVRKFTKPEPEKKVVNEEFIIGIEDKKIESTSRGGGPAERKIPLITGNKVSSEPTMDNYMDTPVEEFGIAMLRGMGWKEDDAKIKPIETYVRPKGIGLGHKLSEK